MTFPENENGYMNNVYGYNYEQFLEWIEKKRNWSLGKELPEGFVPDTTYVLVDEDVYVGVFNLRHCLNDFLREGPGHIGYCISEKYRGRGYATKGLKLTLEKAGQRSIHEVYMSVNKDNPASLRVQMKNGAYIHHHALRRGRQSGTSPLPRRPSEYPAPSGSASSFFDLRPRRESGPCPRQ